MYKAQAMYIDSPSDPIIEPRTQRDNQISVLHSMVGSRMAVHPKHAQRLGVKLIKRAKPLQRSGHGNIASISQLFH
jgi:hypothetical protein